MCCKLSPSLATQQSLVFCTCLLCVGFSCSQIFWRRVARAPPAPLGVTNNTNIVTHTQVVAARLAAPSPTWWKTGKCGWGILALMSRNLVYDVAAEGATIEVWENEKIWRQQIFIISWMTPCKRWNLELTRVKSYLCWQQNTTQIKY